MTDSTKEQSKPKDRHDVHDLIAWGNIILAIIITIMIVLIITWIT